MVSVDVLVRDESGNASVAWALTGLVAVAAVESALTNDLLWSALALVLVAVAVLPAVVTRDWRAMVSWPLLAVGAAAIGVRALGRYPEGAGYVALAAIALVAVVELNAFTSVEMTRRFSIAFAVLTTMALQGVWTVAQYASDLWLGTDFLTSQTELQVDIVLVTGVALAMGLCAEWYFTHVEHVGSHVRPRGSR